MLLRILFALLMSSLAVSQTSAANVPIKLFPMAHYSQEIDKWVDPHAVNYDKPLVSSDYQLQRQQDFLQHWLAPWDKAYVEQTITQTNPSIADIEEYFLNKFDNEGKTGATINYLENFRPATENWIKDITATMPIDSMAHVSYHPEQTAIITRNVSARLLPTNDPSYHDFTLAGEGYPFDNLQVSSVWAGTPIYVITSTKDKRWDLVLTPAFIDWVPANAVAFIASTQQQQLTQAAKKNLGAIVKTQAAILNASQQLDLSAYVGSVFPVVSTIEDMTTILVPHRTASGYADISSDTIHTDDIVSMPLTATPRHFAQLYHTLINRPYGWGGLYFYNDCSQELRGLYAPFGIWIGRNSAALADAGVTVDESSATRDERLAYLIRHGHPFMTAVYIGGHVLQYISHVVNTAEPSGQMAITYQNVWGMHPPSTVSPSWRDVIGESVILPMLSRYPEVPQDASEADKAYFKVTYLDQMPVNQARQIKPLWELMQP